MMGFPKLMAFIKMPGNDCSSRKDPYINISAAARTLSASSSSMAMCLTTPLGYRKLRAMAYGNMNIKMLK